MRNVTIKLNSTEYAHIHTLLRVHTDFIDKLGVHPTIKDSLKEDVNKINLIFHQAKKENEDGHNGSSEVVSR